MALLASEPPPGVSCWASTEGSLDKLDATIVGPPDTAYEGGHFRLGIAVCLFIYLFSYMRTDASLSRYRRGTRLSRR